MLTHLFTGFAVPQRFVILSAAKSKDLHFAGSGKNFHADHRKAHAEGSKKACKRPPRAQRARPAGQGHIHRPRLDKLPDETDSYLVMDAEAIRQRLELGGVKFTPQRYCVMAFLLENPGHPTAAEIFDGVNRLDPRSSRATIYRNLKDLVDAGLVREVAVEGRSARFDLTGTPHHHFICDRCGAVENLDWFDVPRPPAGSVGARVVREYEVILRGLCTGCAPAHAVTNAEDLAPVS